MKKLCLIGVLLVLTPNFCFGDSFRINQLVQEKQRKMAELEKCMGSTKGLKIAGISTLGLTAVGVAGNVVEAKKINEYDDKIESTDKSIAKTQKQIEEKRSELAAKKAEAEQAKNKIGTPAVTTVQGATNSVLNTVPSNSCEADMNKNFTSGVPDEWKDWYDKKLASIKNEVSVNGGLGAIDGKVMECDKGQKLQDCKNANTVLPIYAKEFTAAHAKAQKCGSGELPYSVSSMIIEPAVITASATNSTSSSSAGGKTLKDIVEQDIVMINNTEGKLGQKIYIRGYNIYNVTGPLYDKLLSAVNSFISRCQISTGEGNKNFLITGADDSATGTSLAEKVPLDENTVLTNLSQRVIGRCECDTYNGWHAQGGTCVKK